MKDSILMAIESLCDDIATNTDAEENRKRAESIAALAISGLLLPDDAEDGTEETEGEPTAPEAKSNMPKSGDRFTYNGMSFIILGEEQGGVLAVQEHTLGEEMPFDEDNSNDWRKSTLRKYLNEEHIKKFNKGDLLPFVSDLTADDGLKDYGTSEDYIFLLSCDLYRKYRPYMPKYNNWVWTITPWSCAPGYAYLARRVHTDGSLGSGGADYAHAVAPACLFNPSIFE